MTGMILKTHSVRLKIDITSILILVSGAGIVSLGGTADASKLATGDPHKARRALDGSIRRLAGRGSIGAGWWYYGKQVHKVHANNQSNMLDMYFTKWNNIPHKYTPNRSNCECKTSE